MSEENFQVSDFTRHAIKATLEWFAENTDADVNTDVDDFLGAGTTAFFIEAYTQLVVQSVTSEDDS